MVPMTQPNIVLAKLALTLSSLLWGQLFEFLLPIAQVGRIEVGMAATPRQYHNEFVQLGDHSKCLSPKDSTHPWCEPKTLIEALVRITANSAFPRTVLDSSR